MGLVQRHHDAADALDQQRALPARPLSAAQRRVYATRASKGTWRRSCAAAMSGDSAAA
jgi:hypothetical protein